MAEHGTAIEWTHVPGYKGETWNPVTGCDRVSPGCAHCYALELAAKLKGWGQPRYRVDGDPKTSGPGFGLTLHPDLLDKPLRWKKPRAVFVNSMSDLFHEGIPDEFIAKVFAAMAAAPQHLFMVLTKRPERMREWFASEGRGINRCGTVRNEFDWNFASRLDPMARLFDWPLPNVWLGVTIENRRFVHRADLLRQTPAAVRFISAEPLLGPLVYDAMLDTDGHPASRVPGWADEAECEQLDLTGIDWLIVGGESGKDHRPIDPEWVRDLRRVIQLDNNDLLRTGRQRERELFPRWWGSGTRLFFKQWGGPRAKSGGRELDGRTWDEIPTPATSPSTPTKGSQ